MTAVLALQTPKTPLQEIIQERDVLHTAVALTDVLISSTGFDTDPTRSEIADSFLQCLFDVSLQDAVNTTGNNTASQHDSYDIPPDLESLFEHARRVRPHVQDVKLEETLNMVLPK